MTERLLQFIWQFRYFNASGLRTTNGEPVYIFYPGSLNTRQGPDFLEARIKIGEVLWIGNVEAHLLSSGWIQHRHHRDPNYDNVILHVVWADDDKYPVCGVPVVILQDRTAKLLLDKYERWMNSRLAIPCAGSLKTVEEIKWIAWKERLLIERMQRKYAQASRRLQQNNGHWEETCWWMLARNFGLSVNAEAFEEMARSIPVSLLVRHKNQLYQLESLLLGQTGALAGHFTGEYPLALQEEYRFLRRKYSMSGINIPLHFLRMRPMGFPTVRLAQLAMLIHQSAPFFARIKESAGIGELKQLFQATAGDYWHHHYLVDQASAYRPKKLGRQMVNNIIINTAAPIMFAYGRLHQEQACMEKAMDWIRQAEAEKNAIARSFAALGLNSLDAADSQALIELKTRYCDKRKCLDCAIGHAILGGSHS
ncbi:MAG: DUF2851 family protein [Chitinophagaceae bacterium]|nr:DUF2851 family protein [Chitinophagaceae bacterium]